jgi:hypothetical protein
MLGAHGNPPAAALHDVKQQAWNGQTILAGQRQSLADEPANRAGHGRCIGRTPILMRGAGRLDPQKGAFDRTHPYSLTACTIFSSCILSNDH